MQGSGIAGVDWAAALLKLNEDGSFNLQVGAADLGTGADTVLAQIAAETLGVTLDKMIVCSGDTDFTPFDVGAYASSTTIISGGAVKKASEKVRDHLLRLASKMLDIPVDNLTCRDNQVVTKCECEKSVSMEDLAHYAMYKEKVQVMENASHWNTDSPPPFCAQFAEVEVDTETGHIRVMHLVTAVDLGVAINPMQAEGQSEGAVAQSLGYGLTEEMVLDASGRVINPSFLDYKMLGSKDMPKLTTILVETEEPLGPYGAKSISEIPINAPAPAVANAVFHAIGVRFRKLPIRPEDVLRALREKKCVTAEALGRSVRFRCQGREVGLSLTPVPDTFSRRYLEDLCVFAPLPENVFLIATLVLKAKQLSRKGAKTQRCKPMTNAPEKSFNRDRIAALAQSYEAEMVALSARSGCHSRREQP